MFAINMAREPELPSLWVGFAHPAIPVVSAKDGDTSGGKFHWQQALSGYTKDSGD